MSKNKKFGDDIADKASQLVKPYQVPNTLGEMLDVSRSPSQLTPSSPVVSPNFGVRRRIQNKEKKLIQKYVSLTPVMIDRLENFVQATKISGKPLFRTEVFEMALDSFLKTHGY